MDTLPAAIDQGSLHILLLHVAKQLRKPAIGFAILFLSRTKRLTIVLLNEAG